MLLYPEPWHSILARAGIRPGMLHGSALQRGRQDGAEAIFSASSLLKLSKYRPSAVPEVASQGLTLGNVGIHSLWLKEVALICFPTALSLWMLTQLPISCLLWRNQGSSLEQLNPGLGSQNWILESWLLRLLIEQTYLSFLGTHWVPGSLLGHPWMLESSQEHYEPTVFYTHLPTGNKGTELTSIVPKFSTLKRIVFDLQEPCSKIDCPV